MWLVREFEWIDGCTTLGRTLGASSQCEWRMMSARNLIGLEVFTLKRTSPGRCLSLTKQSCASSARREGYHEVLRYLQARCYRTYMGRR